MAGLFELQLPNESRRRRSSDADPRRSTSTRSDSPTPEDTAREIVSQLVAKQQSARSQPTLSSIFPWRRKQAATPRQTTQAPASAAPSERTSVDVGRARTSLSLDGQTRKDRASPKTVLGKSILSPRPSLSADSAFSSPLAPPSVFRSEDKVAGNAKTALAQAGLGLSLPQIAYPGPSSPISKHMPKRSKSTRPGTSHGSERSSETSSASGSMRRVRSYSKFQEFDKSTSTMEVPRQEYSQSKFLQSASMPEIPSKEASRKGKEPERIKANSSDTLWMEGDSRGRQSHSTLPLSQGSRDKSATRRASWWPARRRVDSSPIQPRPPLPAVAPPPVPERSHHRPAPPIKAPTPILPSFQPLSPLLNDFQITSNTSLFSESPADNVIQKEDSAAVFNIDRSVSPNNYGQGLLDHRDTARSTSTAPPASKQISSHPHRHSLSFGISDFRQLTLSAILFSENSPSNQSMVESSLKRPRSAADASSNDTVQRRRSLTLFGKPSSSHAAMPFVNRDGPLFLRQPASHENTNLNTEAQSSNLQISRQEAQELDFQHITTDLQTSPSQTLVAKSSLRPRSGTAGSMSGSLGGSTSSLPPPSSSTQLFKRLSTNLFTTQSTSAITSPTEPLARRSLNTSGTLNPGSSATSSSGRSRESLGEAYRTSEDGIKKTGRVPTRLPDESPEHFLIRLRESVGRAEIAHVLAGSGDDFYLQSMALYFSRFNFSRDPLDVAVRRLLMEIGLPRETQQIDRVMEAFAARYLKCNPELFTDKDHPYILAFSLIMLHTDAFNKSNKNKMTKADYVKNSRLPGIPTEVLECFFDNIVFAPFIFIEDPEDISSKVMEGPPYLIPNSGPSAMLTATTATGTLLAKSNKIDPYYLITRNLLDPLRADVESQVPKKNPYLYEGTDWPWNMQYLHQLFARAQQLQVNTELFSSATIPVASVPSSGTSTPPRRKSIAMPSFAMGYGPFIGAQSFATFEFQTPPRQPSGRTENMRMIRIAKTGVLPRKDDTIEGGKRAVNRKWKELSVVLTATQLLFFRDLNFASQLRDLAPGGEFHDPNIQASLLNPDEVVSLYEAIAVLDTTYAKKPHAFRLYVPNGRQFVMQCLDKTTLNEWISAINYASAFRSAGVRMRGIGMSHKEAEMMGLAAAASHLNDLRASSTKALTVPPSPIVDLSGTLANNSQSPGESLRSSQLNPSSELLKALSSSSTRRHDDTLQLKSTFEDVKAKLAANVALEESSGQDHPHSPISPSASPVRKRTLSMSSRSTPTQAKKALRRPSTASSTPRPEERGSPQAAPRSRAEVIQSRIDVLDSRINQIKQDLEEELRVIRNLGIMTPFQRSSRDRIQLAVINVAKKIRTLRIDLAKHICYHFVLLSDLTEEEKEREQARRDALEAATRRLSIAENRPAQLSLHVSSPERTTSSYDSIYPVADGSAERNDPMTSVSLLPGGGSVFTSEPQPLQGPTTPTHSPIVPFGEFGYSPVAEGDKKFHTAETEEEIAEEWNETRAAKRVSLVRVPSDIRLSMLNRHVRPLSYGQITRGSGAPGPSEPLNNHSLSSSQP